MEKFHTFFQQSPAWRNVSFTSIRESFHVFSSDIYKEFISEMKGILQDQQQTRPFNALVDHRAFQYKSVPAGLSMHYWITIQN